jgi:hypothetical protein
LWQLQEGGEALAYLVGIVIGCLFAHQNELGLFSMIDGGEEMAYSLRVWRALFKNTERPICPHGERHAQRVFGFGATDAHNGNFGDGTLLTQSKSFLKGDGVEGVHRPAQSSGIESALRS